MTDPDHTSTDKPPEEMLGSGDAAEVGQPAVCLSCGEPLHGLYCSACGQKRRAVNPSLREVLGDWLEQLTLLDSKTMRTLVPLIIKPGVLSLEYFAGRRSRYVSPLKLYLLMSCVMFLTASVTSQHMVVLQYDPEPSAEQAGEAPPSSAAEGVSEPVPEEAEDTDKVVAPMHFEGSADDDDPLWQQRLFRALEETASDPQAMNDRFFAQLPKAVFLIVPVLALMLRVLYLRSPHRYVRHLVLSLHLHTFLALLMTCGMLVEHFSGLKAVSDLVGPLFIIYVFLTLRRIFQQGMLKTLCKMLLLFFGYILILAATMVVTMLILLLPLLL